VRKLIGIPVGRGGKEIGGPLRKASFKHRERTNTKLRGCRDKGKVASRRNPLMTSRIAGRIVRGTDI